MDAEVIATFARCFIAILCGALVYILLSCVKVASVSLRVVLSVAFMLIVWLYLVAKDVLYH